MGRTCAPSGVTQPLPLLLHPRSARCRPCWSLQSACRKANRRPKSHSGWSKTLISTKIREKAFYTWKWDVPVTGQRALRLHLPISRFLKLENQDLALAATSTSGCDPPFIRRKCHTPDWQVAAQGAQVRPISVHRMPSLVI